MTEEKKVVKRPHNLILEGRRSASISGVNDVESFDENTVVLATDLGMLEIHGDNLHVNKLSVDSGELTVDGQIDSVVYTEAKGEKGGLFARLFR